MVHDRANDPRDGSGRAAEDLPPEDPNELRALSAERWEEAAAAWIRNREHIRQTYATVARRLVQAVSPRPGQRILELAAGLGDTGVLAAELVRPGGEVIITDRSEAMLEGARTLARELGAENVAFKVMDAEWIDMPVASLDGIVCRFGLMLLTDPAAALIECRRVLRPQGRLAVAVWDALESNPWSALPTDELVERGIVPARTPGPGPFALAAPGRLQELLEEAGFVEAAVESVDLVRAHPSYEDFWEQTLDLSRSFHDAVMSRAPAEIAEIRAGLERRVAPYRNEDGSLNVPGRALVASAGA